MVETNNANNAAVSLFGEYLDSKGMRRTPERFAILDHVLNMTGHFTIEQLQQQVTDDGFRVSRATCYNTVELLLATGLVRRHVFEGLAAQYERSGPPHTHLICTTCGKVKEVRDVNLAAFMNARRYNAFNTDHYSLCVYGTCSTCARKRRRTRAAEGQKHNVATNKKKQQTKQ